MNPPSDKWKEYIYSVLLLITMPRHWNCHISGFYYTIVRLVSSSQFTCISFLPHDLLVDALHVDIWVMATLRFMLKAFLLSSLTPLSSAFCRLSQPMWLVRRYIHLFFYSWTKSTEPTYLWQALWHTHQHTLYETVSYEITPLREFYHLGS